MIAVLCEGKGYWEELRSAVLRGRIAGPQIHDAHVAALCHLHGVREIWTADRDFNRFPNLPVRNPLVA